MLKRGTATHAVEIAVNEDSIHITLNSDHQRLCIKPFSYILLRLYVKITLQDCFLRISIIVTSCY